MPPSSSATYSAQREQATFLSVSAPIMPIHKTSRHIHLQTLWWQLMNDETKTSANTGTEGSSVPHRARGSSAPRTVTWSGKLLMAGVSAAERLRMWLLGQSWFQSRLMPALPRQLRWLLRTIYLTPIDLGDRLLGRRDPSMPAKARNFTQ